MLMAFTFDVIGFSFIDPHALDATITGPHRVARPWPLRHGCDSRRGAQRREFPFVTSRPTLIGDSPAPWATG